MRIVKNEKVIQARGRWARILMPLGLVFLVGGLILSLQTGNQTSQIMAWAALIGGVLCSSFGIGLADKWLSVPGRPRADQALETALNSLDIKHKLYSWALPAAEQVLLSPAGLTVFLVKSQEGVIQCQDGKWKNKMGILKMLSSLSRERLGNPTKDLERHIAQVKQLATAAVPDADIPVDGIIVFSNAAAQVQVEGCTDNVATPETLRNKFREVTGGGKRITDTAYRQIEEAFDNLAGPSATTTTQTATRSTSATRQGGRFAKDSSRKTSSAKAKKSSGK
ncbi:MAG: nuclease-related domain-containing protein [Anaerolineae bacterium]